MKTKPIWMSTTIISGTAMLTLLLTITSLYFKSVGNNLWESIPLVVLSISTFAMNVNGRIKADTQLTIK